MVTTIKDRYPQFIRVVEGKSSNPALGPCWEWGYRDDNGVWHGTRTPDGYGKVTIRGVKLLSHRVAVAMGFGEIKEGEMALHECDNPPCVRVEGPGGMNHLKPGSRADNLADSWAKGRMKRHTRGARKLR